MSAEYDAFEPTPDLERGDVGMGDTVQFRVGYLLVRGRVEEQASDGGVVGIYVDGRPYSASIRYVRVIEKATPIDVLEIRIIRLERELKEVRTIAERTANRSWTIS